MARPLAGLPGAAAIALLILAAPGCGGGRGVESGATVTAYVAAPLCSEAKRELLASGGRAGDLSVRAVCLPSVRAGKRLSLATIGANARRATEDSTAVAFLEPPEPRAARFARPILESAEVPWVASASGRGGMSRLLGAIRDWNGSDSLRSSVAAELD